MKKIYINENSVSSVINGRLLPRFLYKMVKAHCTSLGDNGAFPNVGDYPFDYTLLKTRYNEVCDEIEAIGLGSCTEDELMTELSELLKRAKELETPVRDSLEKICENALNKLFAIPEESINLIFKLVDRIKFKSAIRLRPESNVDLNHTFKDIKDIEFSNKAIEKRRFIDALIQGASYTYAKVEGLYISDIDRINPELPRLYRRIRIINDYLLFIKKEKMTDDKPMQGSYVETHLGIGDSKTTIKVQGIIFPLLFQEAIRGMLELFSSHGLPKDKKNAMHIIKKADFVLAEPWDLRLGVGLWDMIFGRVEDTNMIPYMFTSFVRISIDEFNDVVKEILASTEKGNEIIEELMKEAEYDNGYQQFTNRINARNVDKSLIKDSYFTGAETNGYELDSEEEEGVIEEDSAESTSWKGKTYNYWQSGVKSITFFLMNDNSVIYGSKDNNQTHEEVMLLHCYQILHKDPPIEDGRFIYSQAYDEIEIGHKRLFNKLVDDVKVQGRVFITDDGSYVFSCYDPLSSDDAKEMMKYVAFKLGLPREACYYVGHYGNDIVTLLNS